MSSDKKADHNWREWREKIILAHQIRMSFVFPILVSALGKEHVASQRIPDFLEVFLIFPQYCGEQEKNSIIRMRIRKKKSSLAITFCHHSASLAM